MAAKAGVLRRKALIQTPALIFLEISMQRIQNIYPIVRNEKLCPRFYRMSFDAPEIRDEVKAGQFLHLHVHEGLEPFFRRPFSVYRAKDTVDIFYEPVGPGTRIMTTKKPGDTMDIVGPVGTPFRLPPDGTKQVVMIAGGIGIAPFLLLSDTIKDMGYELVLLYGGRTGDHVYPMREFSENGCAVHVSTDDGSVGMPGRVSGLFDKIALSPSTYIYTCGPNPMMAAVQRFAGANGLKGQAACEEIMACALGACLGCSIQTTKGYKTVCYEGPCFELDEVIFHA
jgi:dihydroorotate dehydrogenase electron transfer subunit